MKLVMEYSAGDESCSCEYVLCFEYESKEKFLFDLELKVIEAQEKFDKFYEVYYAWQEKNPEKDGRLSPKKLTEATQQWYAQKPEDEDVWNFQFAGHWFELRTFLYDDGRIRSTDDNYRMKGKKFMEPTLLELEEWFQGKLNDR